MKSAQAKACSREVRENVRLKNEREILKTATAFSAKDGW